MFESPAFDVAIGLIFLYVVLALVCSTINETISTANRAGRASSTSGS